MAVAAKWVLGAGLLAALAGCSGDDEAGERTWDSCELSGESCTCLIQDIEPTGGFPPADSCAGFNCCLLSENVEHTTAACVCADVDEPCEDVAAESDRVAVAQCPPPGEALASTATCVPEGGRCPNRAHSETSGCCGDLLCLSNGANDPVSECTAVPQERHALAQQCERATLSTLDWLEVDEGGAVATADGAVTFDSVSAGNAIVGPGACIAEVTMRFVAGQPDASEGSCVLELTGQLLQGAFRVPRVSATLSGCAGYPASAEGGPITVMAPEPIAFEFSFEGEDCGAFDGFHEDCVSGTFDWHLLGAIGALTFEDSHLKARGVLCGVDRNGMCDAR